MLKCQGLMRRLQRLIIVQSILWITIQQLFHFILKFCVFISYFLCCWSSSNNIAICLFHFLHYYWRRQQDLLSTISLLNIDLWLLWGLKLLNLLARLLRNIGRHIYVRIDIITTSLELIIGIRFFHKLVYRISKSVDIFRMLNKMEDHRVSLREVLDRVQEFITPYQANLCFCWPFLISLKSVLFILCRGFRLVLTERLISFGNRLSNNFVNICFNPFKLPPRTLGSVNSNYFHPLHVHNYVHRCDGVMLRIIKFIS
jgi:hypothetical protein